MNKRPHKPPDRPPSPRFREAKPKRLPSKRARSTSRKLADATPSANDATRFFWELETFKDIHVALLGASYLDRTLARLLRASFVSLDIEDEKRLFDGSSNGVLGTFSNKIRICYAIGLIDFDVYSDLLLISHIRNAFAHSVATISFQTEEIIADCLKLISLHNHVKDNWKVDISSLSPRDLFIETVCVTYARLLFSIRRKEKRRGGQDRDQNNP